MLLSHLRQTFRAAVIINELFYRNCSYGGTFHQIQPIVKIIYIF